MKSRYLFVLPLLLPVALWAQTQTTPEEAGMPSQGADAANAFGNQTRTWVDLQTSGTASVQTTPPLSGDVATHIYQRYVKSFDHPIPEQFTRQKFVEGGGSGSSGG